MERQQDLAIKTKIIIVGDTSVGKTSIIKNYIERNFKQGQASTIGIDFGFKDVNFRDKTFKLWIHDTAGQQRYRSFITTYFNQVSAVIIVVNLIQSLDQICKRLQNWIHFLEEQHNLNFKQQIIIIVGNKLDLIKKEEKELKLKQVQNATKKYQQQHNCSLLFSSAKTGENIEQIFINIVQRIYDKKQKESVIQNNQKKIYIEKKGFNLNVNTIKQGQRKRCC